MSEILTLTTPITQPSVTTYDVLFISLDWQNARIVIRVKGSNGVELPEIVYEGTPAVSLMTTLNSANLSVKSLYKRTIEKLQADGRLPAGTISGTPA